MDANAIKEYGLSIGYSRVGITSTASLAGYVDEVESRGDKYEIFGITLFNPLKGALPREIMPEARSVIVLIWDYFQVDFPESLQKMIGKVYMARCYNSPPGTVAHARLGMMKDFLVGQGFAADAEIPVPARWAAAQAGVATYGRNNFAYVEGIGSYVLVNTIVVDRELEYDEPTMDCKCPPNCRICMDACPTGAIYEPFRLDPARCIGFNNWTRQDGRGKISSFIPHELRAPIGSHVHGCDVCQDACPRNRKKLKQSKAADGFVERIAPDLTLPAILNMTDDFYERRIKPIMYNYIKEKRYFIRNAAIAMGNSGDETYVDDLAAAAVSPDGMIREYATWALGEIGGKRARQVLAARLSQEPDEGVRLVIEQALGQR